MKKKGLFIGLFILFLLLIGAGVGGYFFYQSKQLEVKMTPTIQVSLNDVVYNLDFIQKTTNGMIKTKKKALDTSQVGEYDFTIQVQNYFKKIQNFTFHLIVVDTEAPVITFQPSLSVEEGGSIDLLKDVSATDNSQEEIAVTVEGEYDFNTPGTYSLTYVAKDSSGNETREAFTLEVTKKVVVVAPVYRDSYVAPDTTFTTANGHSGVVRGGVTYIDGILIANKTYSLPSSYNPGDLTSETKAAFHEMVNAAASDGYSIYVVSGFRSYNYQKNLYNRYVNKDGKAAADTYSARPGHSEHQTGLAFDLNKIDYNFGNQPEGIWLNQNAYKYGFILRYPEGKTGETGYVYEAWHYRYVGKELAAKLYNGGNWITLESYFGITSQYNY